MSDISASDETLQDRRGEPRESSDRRAGPRPRLGNFQFSSGSSLISPHVVTSGARFIEFLLIAGFGYAIFFSYIHSSSSLTDQAGHILYAIAIVIAASGAILSFQALRLYDISIFSNLFRQIAGICAGWTVTFALLMAIAFFAKLGEEYSRVWVAGWYVSGLSALIVFRTALCLAVRNWSRLGRLNRRAVIVGGGPAAHKLIKALEASRDTDIRIYGVFDDRDDNRVSDRIAGYPRLGNIDELIEFGRDKRLDLLILTLPITAEKRLLELYQKLWVLPVDIRLSAHTNKLRFRPRAYSYIGNVPFIDMQDKAITDWDYVLKWVFDKVVASTLLLLLSPVMALIALAVKLDSPGPVFFKQKRHGFNNELIGVYKFRSMYTDKSDSNAAKLVTKNDDRVTRVGRFIRKTSLDELPQLFNVLKGELSLVGPRPHALQAKAAESFYADVVDGYFARHRVKPGITGWAQVNGWRGETDTHDKLQRRVEHDLYYIENWSIFLDLYILAMTPFALMKAENAY
ncbi:MAG: undecaprenyl-phosphate glucose phosphotransferase [Hyphomicrobiaceae bacterium]|nr:undecaprenyl-phosphate glucose phosphotransferase [Hyphomicrobiaceae bacterium]